MNTNQHEYDDLDEVVRELAARGVGVESQAGYPVDYGAQCINYLKASGLRLALLTGHGDDAGDFGLA